jgi:hypothetical protein
MADAERGAASAEAAKSAAEQTAADASAQRAAAERAASEAEAQRAAAERAASEAEARASEAAARAASDASRREDSELAAAARRHKADFEAAKEIIALKEKQLLDMDDVREERDVLAQMVRALRAQEAQKTKVAMPKWLGGGRDA